MNVSVDVVFSAAVYNTTLSDKKNTAVSIKGAGDLDILNGIKVN